MYSKTMSARDYSGLLAESSRELRAVFSSNAMVFPHPCREWEYSLALHTMKAVGGRSLLDVGGGRGPMADAFDLLGYEVTIVDPVMDKRSSPRIKLLQGTTIADNPIKHDVVSCISVLEHVRNLLEIYLSLFEWATKAIVITVDFSPEGVPCFPDQRRIFTEADMCTMVSTAADLGWAPPNPPSYPHEGRPLSARYNFASLVLVST